MTSLRALASDRRSPNPVALSSRRSVDSNQARANGGVLSADARTASSLSRIRNSSPLPVVGNRGSGIPYARQISSASRCGSITRSTPSGCRDDARLPNQLASSLACQTVTTGSRCARNRARPDARGDVDIAIRLGDQRCRGPSLSPDGSGGTSVGSETLGVGRYQSGSDRAEFRLLGVASRVVRSRSKQAPEVASRDGGWLRSGISAPPAGSGLCAGRAEARAAGITAGSALRPEQLM
jgi:hypothetical protein